MILGLPFEILSVVALRWLLSSANNCFMSVPVEGSWSMADASSSCFFTSRYGHELKRGRFQFRPFLIQLVNHARLIEDDRVHELIGQLLIACGNPFPLLDQHIFHVLPISLQAAWHKKQETLPQKEAGSP